MKMVEWIADDLGVTSLRYQNLDDMVAAIGLPREKLCLYCWNGEYPHHERVTEATEKGKVEELIDSAK
jgi:amidophosphoribosyltransferase